MLTEIVKAGIIFQEDTRVLRRQLYEKRPQIENKLMSGRQFLASEPQAGDTSDSDSKSESGPVLCICVQCKQFSLSPTLSSNVLKPLKLQGCIVSHSKVLILYQLLFTQLRTCQHFYVMFLGLKLIPINSTFLIGFVSFFAALLKRDLPFLHAMDGLPK